MNERLLQYIWQFQYFNKNDLIAAGGEQLDIIYPGIYNCNQGPDFLEAKIRIGEHVWVGSVELHLTENDWYRHNHHHDGNYDNVILHVVWNHVEERTRLNLPTLILNNRIPGILLKQYRVWMENESFIPCEKAIGDVNELTWKKWKERLLFERLKEKSTTISDWLAQRNYHWEEALWWSIARSFGLVVNADAFCAVIRSVSISVYQRHYGRVEQLEALLLGQAGLLDGEVTSDYGKDLLKEYLFLKEKYGLVAVDHSMHFLRMRPGCFPTIRLAQLAMLIHRSGMRLAWIINDQTLSDVKKMLDVSASRYWDTHYTLNDESNYLPKKTGTQLVNTIIINAIVPFIYTYGEYHKEERYIYKAVDWLAGIKAEKNSITEKFASLGLNAHDSSDSQALLEMKKKYCDKKRCLDCAIGSALLQGNAEPLIVPPASSDTQC